MMTVSSSTVLLNAIYSMSQVGHGGSCDLCGVMISEHTHSTHTRSTDESGGRRWIHLN